MGTDTHINEFCKVSSVNNEAQDTLKVSSDCPTGPSDNSVRARPAMRFNSSKWVAKLTYLEGMLELHTNQCREA
jgi:hypothetical protein